MEWIKVSPDTMPPDKQPVIVTVHYKDWGKPKDPKGFVLPVAWRKDNMWCGPCSYGPYGQYSCEDEGASALWYKWVVTDWMPLPKPAEG